MSAIIGVIVGWFGGVAIHELGHAVAAWVTGQGVHSVCIGSGRRIIRTKFAGTIWEINLHPFAGEVWPKRRAPMSSWATRFLYLAGPGANILLLVLVLMFAYHSRGHTSAFWIGLSIPQIILIYINLIPNSFVANGETRFNDGAHAALSFGSWTWMPKKVKALYWQLLAPYLVPGEELGSIFPAKSSWFWKVGYPAENVDEYLSDGFAAIDDPSKTGQMSRTEYLYLVDVITTRWLTNGAMPGFGDYAERATRQALAFSPGSTNIRHTRGGVLVELGRFAEARDLILESQTPNDSGFELALNNYYLAQAKAGLGDLEGARIHAASARKAVEANMLPMTSPNNDIGRLVLALEGQLGIARSRGD